jgi:hypothetical protein
MCLARDVIYYVGRRQWEFCLRVCSEWFAMGMFLEQYSQNILGSFTCFYVCLTLVFQSVDWVARIGLYFSSYVFLVLFNALFVV